MSDGAENNVDCSYSINLKRAWHGGMLCHAGVPRFLRLQEAQEQQGERRVVCIGVRIVPAAPMLLPTCPAGWLAGWLADPAVLLLLVPFYRLPGPLLDDRWSCSSVHCCQSQ